MTFLNYLELIDYFFFFFFLKIYYHGTPVLNRTKSFLVFRNIYKLVKFLIIYFNLISFLKSFYLVCNLIMNKFFRKKSINQEIFLLNDKIIKYTILYFSILSFNYFILFFFFFNSNTIFFIYNLEFSFIKYIINVFYSLYMDNLSLVFIILTFFLVPLCLLISWYDDLNNFIKYSVIFIFLKIFLINVFLARDIFIFYIAFECILIPMFFLIGCWGSRSRRVHATFQFFLYTLGGSLLMLIGIILCQYQYGTTNVDLLMELDLEPKIDCFLFLCFFIAFAVKIPLMPVHIWLPEAHVESPTGGSVALAGILLKLGTYGILRFILPLFKFSIYFFSPFIYLICLIGILYGCLTTIRQIDIKKVIAYSSVIHMNFLVLGLFVFNVEGLLGSIFLMVSHAFVSGGLFVCVGILYDRYGTRLIKYYGGLTVLMPIFSTFFLIFTLANISFPGTMNFIGEFLVILGLFMVNPGLAVLIIFIMILSTCYALWLYNKLFSGLLTSYVITINGINKLNVINISRNFIQYYTDINFREVISLVYLIVPTLVFGFIPMPFLNFLEYSMLFLLNL